MLLDANCCVYVPYRQDEWHSADWSGSRAHAPRGRVLVANAFVWTSSATRRCDAG